MTSLEGNSAFQMFKFYHWIVIELDIKGGNAFSSRNAMSCTVLT